MSAARRPSLLQIARTWMSEGIKNREIKSSDDLTGSDQPDPVLLLRKRAHGGRIAGL